MGRTAVNKTTFIPNGGHAETLQFTLVSKLLGTVLDEQHQEILIKTHSQNFSYNSGSRMKRGDTLTTKIACDNLAVTEDDFEISFTGTVENQFGHRDRCRMYFFLCWDPAAITLSKSSDKGNITLQNKALFIYSENSPRCLPDTAFELDLYRKTLSGSQQFLAQGRGYLAFDRQH